VNSATFELPLQIIIIISCRALFVTRKVGRSGGDGVVVAQGSSVVFPLDEEHRFARHTFACL
jgi:hypothetical protein